MIDAEGLSLTLDKKHRIFDDVSFSVQAGQTLLLSGKNGSGKSLLLKTLKGLLRPSGGKIVINGEDVSAKHSRRLALTGLVFQDTDLQIVAQTVRKDLLFGLQNMRVEKAESERRITRIADQLEISHLLEKRPALLSGGERRRVALAGVMVMNPSVIFLDEPFANLDYPGIRQVLRSIISLQESGATLIIATHEVEKVAAHCDSIVILDEGTVVLKGTCEKVLPSCEPYGIRVPRTGGSDIPVSELTWLI